MGKLIPDVENWEQMPLNEARTGDGWWGKGMTLRGGLEIGKITLSGKWFTMVEDKPLWLLALMALGGLILIPIHHTAANRLDLQ